LYWHSINSEHGAFQGHTFPDLWPCSVVWNGNCDIHAACSLRWSHAVSDEFWTLYSVCTNQTENHSYEAKRGTLYTTYAKFTYRIAAIFLILWSSLRFLHLQIDCCIATYPLWHESSASSASCVAGQCTNVHQLHQASRQSLDNEYPPKNRGAVRRGIFYKVRHKTQQWSIKHWK
jgi:hypothetical protein